MVTALDPAALRLRAEMLDRILNRQILPLIGLHAAIIASLLLSLNLGPAVALGLGFAAVAGCIGLAAWWHRSRGRPDDSIRAEASIATFLTLAVLTLPFGPTAKVAIVGAGFLLFSWLVYRGRMAPDRLVFPFIYLALFLVTLMKVSTEEILLGFAMPSAAALYVMWRRSGFRNAYGPIVGLIIVLAGRLYTNPTPTMVDLVVVALFLIALVWYQTKTGSATVSNLRSFLSQALAVIGSWIAVELLLPVEEKAQLWTWVVLVAAYSGAMIYRFGREALAIRLVWLAVPFWVALWYGVPFELGEPRLWLSFALTLGTIVLLSWATAGLRNGFACNVVRLVAIATGMVLVNLVSSLRGVVVGAACEAPLDGCAVARKLTTDFSGSVAIAAAFIVATFFVATFTARPIPFASAVPWWRGLIRPRHVVIIRTAYRRAESYLDRVPVIGNMLVLTKGGLASLRYLSGDARALKFAEMTLITSAVIGVLATIPLLESILTVAAHTSAEVADLFKQLKAKPAAIAILLAWLTWGAAMHLWAFATGRLLLFFLGVGFVLLPPLRFFAFDKFPDVQFFSLIILSSGLLLLLFGLMRRDA